MLLSFPNPSRRFDATKSRVRFWGYDGVIEISFFVEGAALQKVSPEVSNSDVGLLKAFDATRTRIYEVAEKVYTRGHNTNYTYILTAQDF